MQMNNTHCELLKTLLVLTNTSSGNLTFCNHHASRFFFFECSVRYHNRPRSMCPSCISLEFKFHWHNMMQEQVACNG